MKKITLHILLALAVYVPALCMSKSNPAASNLLAELKATLAKRKAAKKIETRLAHRRSVMKDSDTDSDSMASQGYLENITPSKSTPPSCPARSLTPPALAALDTTASMPATHPESSSSSTSSSEYSTSSDDDTAYASDFSDIEPQATYTVKQESYSTGLFGEHLTTPTGLLAHLSRIKEAKQPLANCYQHSVSQYLDKALLSLADTVIEQLTVKQNSDFIQKLAALKELKGIIDQLNVLKSLAEYHNLTATHATIQRAEKAAQYHALSIDETEQLATKSIRAQKAPLNEAWSSAKILTRAIRLKKGAVGMPSNSAAMDALTFRVAQTLKLQAQTANVSSQATDLLQAQQLLRILKAKQFPLNPHSTRALFEALMALESKVDEERKAHETNALILEDDIERVLEKLTAYVQEEAKNHTLSAQANTGTTTCPDSDAQDE